MRVQQFYVHRALLLCILEESGRAQKRNDLLQVLKRERAYIQENQQQQQMFEQRFSRLCAQSSGVPRWVRFSSHPSIWLDTNTGMIWPTVWGMHTCAICACVLSAMCRSAEVTEHRLSQFPLVLRAHAPPRDMPQCGVRSAVPDPRVPVRPCV